MDTENFSNSNDINPEEHLQTDQPSQPVSAGIEKHTSEEHTSKNTHDPSTDAESDHSNDTIDDESEIADHESDDDLISVIESTGTTGSEEEPQINLSDLRVKIGAIESDVRVWRSRRETLNSQVIDKAKSRNELNAKVRELINTANEEKNSRDAANKEIATLKEEKQQLQQEIEQLQKNLEKADAEIGKASPPTTKFSMKDIERQIKDLEWKLQTTSNLTREEEKELVDRISTLEEQQVNLQEYKELSKEKREILEHLRTNRQKLRKSITQMNKRVRESRAHHTKMIEAFNEATVIRKQADSIHAEIQKIKQDADAVHQEYVAKIKEKRKLSEKVRKVQRKEREVQEREEKEKMQQKTDIAVQKTKEGKKISFEDFKALINRGLI